MVITVALARASRATGLFYASLLIAASWAVGIGVYFIEVELKRSLLFVYPAIDGIAAGLIMLLATRPNYPGRAPLVIVASLLLAQAFYQAAVTTYGYYNPKLELDIPYLVVFGVNRLFEVILLSIWAVSILRIIRMRHPELHEILWRTVGVLPPVHQHSEPVEFKTQDEFDKHIGAKLIEARRSLGWSTERLASECALTADEVADYEKGRTRVPPSTLQELSRSLGVKLNFFTEGLERTR